MSLPALSFSRHLVLPTLTVALASGHLRAIAVQANSSATGERTPAWLLLLGGAVALAAVGIALNRRRLMLVQRAHTAEASALRVLASEERFRRLFDQGADPQLLSDGERIVAANPAAIALLADGHGERLLGIRTQVITAEADLVMDRDDVTYETDVLTVEGTLIPAAVRRTRIPLDRGELLHFQLRDLRDTRRLESERRELETQLLASQRLEALGTLAGGVAHDFNNLLTIIRANAEIAQITLAERDDAGVLESLNAVVHASDRARDIVRQILLFSRRSVPTQARLNLAALITDARTLLRATIPSTVQLLLEVRTAEAWITGDATQMQQVLLNLCSNAEHAMRRTGGGMLRVTVDLVSLDAPAPDATHPRLAVGRYVRLQVRDTGCGMSDDVRQRIFEPFFTTKPIGEGTGLGLAVLHGIVMSHHGSVHVESAEGRGTTFELLFNLVAPAEEWANTMLTSPLRSTAVVTPRDRAPADANAPLVLLVDDEQGILRAAARGIVATGMRVITANGGRDALALLERHPDVSVVITDQTMPEMTGLMLAEHVRTSRPGLPIILSTGYTGRATAESLRDHRFDTVLDKPYTLAQLTDAIDVALRAARRQTERA